MPLDDSVAISINGIVCWDEGEQAHFARGLESRSTRILRCAWTDRIALVSFLMGGSTSLGGLPLFAAGQPHPEYAYWLVRSVDCDGEGLMSVGASGMIAYERACLKVSYGPPDWNDQDPALVGDEELDFSSTALSMGNGASAFKYTSDNVEVPVQLYPAINITTVSFRKVRYRLPVLPSALIMSLVDHTNNASFFGAAAGQVIFRGAQSKREITALGDRNWTVSYAFEFSSIGWDKLARPGATPPFQQIAYKNGDALFPPADLSLLFK